MKMNGISFTDSVNIWVHIGLITVSSRKEATSSVSIFTWLISMAYSTAIEYMDMTTTRSDSPLSKLRLATGLANAAQTDIIHVHDHHTALIPFMLQCCYAFKHLADIPTVFTIHNAQYQGWMGWDKSHYLPAWDTWKGGLLEWDHTINPLASAVKTASKVTTVSHSYLGELTYMANGLEKLFEYEKGKCTGILNGIEREYGILWPMAFLQKIMMLKKLKRENSKTKERSAESLDWKQQQPLFVFVGRLVGEKAADLLPDSISSSIYQHHGNCNFLVLGSGEPMLSSNWKPSSTNLAVT